MIKLTPLLNESEASEEAKKKGLVSKGWGFWADKSGKTVAKTADGKLQFIHPDDDTKSTLDFAKTVHGDQKYGTKPYIYHLRQVFDIAVSHGGSADELKASILHDVLEDTQVSKEVLEKQFGPKVAHLVDLLSNQPSKKETFERIRTDKSAVFVKLCDRLANVYNKAKNEKYRREQPLFKSILYKPGEFDSLWSEIEHQLEIK